MRSPGPVPPHSVMPETLALRSGGYLLTGGRSGLYLWHCADTACVDGGGWQSFNLARHHNELAAGRELCLFQPFDVCVLFVDLSLLAGARR